MQKEWSTSLKKGDFVTIVGGNDFKLRWISKVEKVSTRFVYVRLTFGNLIRFSRTTLQGSCSFPVVIEMPSPKDTKEYIEVRERHRAFKVIHNADLYAIPRGTLEKIAKMLEPYCEG